MFLRKPRSHSSWKTRLFSHPDSIPSTGDVAEDAQGEARDDEHAQWQAQALEQKAKAADFLSTAHIMDNVLILFASLQPQINLMAKMLQMAGGDWHLMQLWNLQRQGEKQNMLDALSCDGGALDRMLQETMQVLTTPTMFRFLQQTEDNATSILASVLRMGATVHEQAHSPLQRWPFRLFRLLHDAEFAHEVVRESRCCMDPFTLTLLSHWPTVEGLQSDGCRTTLHMIKEMLDLNIYSTERLHSRSQRRQKSRAQTSAADLGQLAVWPQAAATWPWCTRALAHKNAGPPPEQPPDIEGHGEASHEHQDGEPGEACQPDAKRRRKRRGGGGAYRAYIHQVASQGRLRGCRQFPSWLKEEFAQLSQEQRDFCEELGRKAAKAHSSGATSFPDLRAASSSASMPAVPSAAALPDSHGLVPPEVVPVLESVNPTRTTKEFDVAVKAVAKALLQRQDVENLVQPDVVETCIADLCAEGSQRLPALQPYLVQHPGVQHVFMPHIQQHCGFPF